MSKEMETGMDDARKHRPGPPNESLINRLAQLSAKEGVAA